MYPYIIKHQRPSACEQEDLLFMRRVWPWGGREHLEHTKRHSDHGSIPGEDIATCCLQSDTVGSMLHFGDNLAKTHIQTLCKSLSCGLQQGSK